MNAVIALAQPLPSTKTNGGKLRFWTADEIGKAVPPQWTWIARPWAAEGAITEVDGKPKSAGKTTWGLYLVKAVVDGADFLGEPTTKTPVVYLTEQSSRTFGAALHRTGLVGRTDLSVLFWPETRRATWVEILVAAREKCKETGAKLLIIDTLARFAGMAGDSENNAGDALKIMRPLRMIAEHDELAVVVMRHERKSGGEVGDSGRGSSAFAGEVDVVLSIRRPEGNQRANVRHIRGFSRDDGEFERVIALTPTGYVSHGTVKAVATQEARAAILSAVPKKEKRAVTRQRLLEKAGLPDNTTGRRAIEELLKEKHLALTGAGKKGDPHRYWASRESD